MQPENYSINEKIFNVEEPITHLYFIKKGEVEISYFQEIN
jgi:hypothetical protein